MALSFKTATDVGETISETNEAFENLSRSVDTAVSALNRLIGDLTAERDRLENLYQTLE
jgi:ABC-type transporter Mla subunit MlaD